MSTTQNSLSFNRRNRDSCLMKPPNLRSGVLLYLYDSRCHCEPVRTLVWQSSAEILENGRATCFLLRCPVYFSLAVQLRQLPTAATRSPHCICHRQRSVHSPRKPGNANTRESGRYLALFLCAILPLTELVSEGLVI